MGPPLVQHGVIEKVKTGCEDHEVGIVSGTESISKPREIRLDRARTDLHTSSDLLNAEPCGEAVQGLPSARGESDRTIHAVPPPPILGVLQPVESRERADGPMQCNLLIGICWRKRVSAGRSGEEAGVIRSFPYGKIRIAGGGGSAPNC